MCYEFIALIQQLPEQHRDTLAELLIHLDRLVVYLVQWSNCGGRRGYGVPLPFLAGERRSPSLHDDSYLQHKQQKKMCVKYMI